MTRLFLDANILFSSSNQNSIVGRLVIEAWRRVDLVYSESVAEEARRNLTAKRREWLAGLDSVLGLCEEVQDAFFPIEIELFEGDQIVLCTAIRAKCDHLVTGDKRHFGPYFGTTIRGTSIISTYQLAELLKSTTPRDSK
jgi:predicted nucleic acid-binding protein